jgi:hypothetical protein
MKIQTDNSSPSELRVHIAEMRRQLLDVNHVYQSAKRHALPEQIGQLLQHKSELTRKLLDAQRELLQAYRLELPFEGAQRF